MSCAVRSTPKTQRVSSGADAWSQLCREDLGFLFLIWNHTGEQPCTSVPVKYLPGGKCFAPPPPVPSGAQWSDACSSYRGRPAIVRSLRVDARERGAFAGGVTALIVACQSGHVEIARLLIARNADVGQADNDGETPLLAACESGHVEIVRLLSRAGRAFWLRVMSCVDMSAP